MMLSVFRPDVQDTGGVDSMETLDGMKFLISFTSLLVIQPRRKVRSVWIAVLEKFFYVLDVPVYGYGV